MSASNPQSQSTIDSEAEIKQRIAFWHRGCDYAELSPSEKRDIDSLVETLKPTIAQETNKAVVEELKSLKANPYYEANAHDPVIHIKEIDERIGRLTADKEQA